MITDVSSIIAGSTSTPKPPIKMVRMFIIRPTAKWRLVKSTVSKMQTKTVD